MRKFIDPDTWEQEQELKAVISDKATYNYIKELGDYVEYIDLNSVDAHIDYENNNISFEMNIPKEIVGEDWRELEHDIMYRLGGNYEGGPGRSFQKINLHTEEEGDYQNVSVFIRWGLDV